MPHTPAPMYLQLRERIITTAPGEVGITPTAALPRVWGVLTELGYPQGIATLVSLADGTTSLYTSNGGGIIGGGEHAAVARASRELVAMAELFVDDMLPCTTCLLPVEGRVRFHVLTFGGMYSTDGDERTVQRGGHQLSPLYNAAQIVISRLRESSPQQRT